MIAAGVAAFGLTITIMIIFSRGLIKRIQDLGARAQRFANGDSIDSIELVPADDEIGLADQAFRQMAALVAERQEALHGMEALTEAIQPGILPHANPIQLVAAQADHDHRAQVPTVVERTSIPATTQLLFFGMIALVAGHIAQARRTPRDCDLYVAAASIFLLIPWIVVSFVTLRWIAAGPDLIVWLVTIPARVQAILAVIPIAAVLIALGYLVVTRLVHAKDLLRQRAGWIVGIGIAALRPGLAASIARGR